MQMKSTIPETGVPIAKPADKAPTARRPRCTAKSCCGFAITWSKATFQRAHAFRNGSSARCFGISRTPLREALKVLAAEGLIELLPNRGARVRQLSERDLEELFDVMAGLESLAGRLACEAITDEEIAAIERLHYEMYGHYLNSDMHGYFQVNQRIHESIVAAARNETLRTAYASFAGRIRRVRYSANFARKRQRWGEAMREHEAILDALRRRAGSELSDILFQHLRNKRTAAIEHLTVARGCHHGHGCGRLALPIMNS